MEQWDCVIVGGGSAGLSAALVLGRARRRTLVIDAGNQSNLAAAAIGGLLGNDRRPPAELYAAAREEIGAYSRVELRTGAEVVGAKAEGSGFVAELADGSRVEARKMLLVPGMEYRTPDLPGLRERWGGPVFHCPFCHGWEVREGRLGVLGSGAVGVQKALLLRAWSEEVTLLTHDGEAPGAEELASLRAAGITLEERPLTALTGGEKAPATARFRDGSELELDGLLVPITLHQRSPLVRDLGVAFDSGPLSEETIEVGPTFQTTVAGLYAAGDACGQMPSVANAIASGSGAAAMIVHSLMTEN